MVVAIEVVSRRSAEPGLPLLLEQDQNDVEGVAKIAQCEQSLRECLPQHEMRCLRGAHSRREVRWQLDQGPGPPTGEPHPEHVLESRILRQVGPSLTRPVPAFQFPDLTDHASGFARRHDHRDPDGVRHCRYLVSAVWSGATSRNQDCTDPRTGLSAAIPTRLYLYPNLEATYASSEYRRT